jgi:cytoskeletal protein CcmA (bactofilin family)
MALWKDQAPAKPAAGNPPPSSPEPVRLQPEAVATPTPAAAPAPVAATPAARPARQVSESIIAADLTIEGKIHGTGHVRIAGQFKGDVNVEGDLTIEKGAKLTGGVKAQKIVIAGELDGNVENAKRFELLDGGVLNGDLKAGEFTVAAGSRMRGSVEFGWDDKSGRKGDEA